MSLPDKPADGQSSRPSRGVGDAPGIGRVSKMRRDTRPPEQRAATAGKPAGKATWRDFKPTLAHGLMVFLVLGGVVIAGLAVWVVASGKKKPATPEIAAPEVPADATVVRKFPAPSPAELEEQVKAFLKVRNPDELSGMIRKTGQEPAAMVEKLAKLEAADGKLKRVKYLFPLQSRCLQLEAVLVDFVTNRNRLAMISPDAKGKWRIDFDAFDRYSSPAWDTLLSGAAAEGKVRVNVAPDVYYNGHFRDESKWVCYGMQSPDSEQTMLCYAARDSAQHKALESVLVARGEIDTDLNGRSMVRRVLLGIRHLPDTEKRQFEVTRVYSDEWAEGTKAFDEIIVGPSSELKTGP